MPTLFGDLRYAVLAARRHPGFTAAALITLGLGIGTATAIFSIVYGVLLRPLPYPAGDRLIRIWEEYPGGTSAAGNRWLSNHTYVAWAAHARTLDGIASYATYDRTVTFGTESMRMAGSAVSPSVFTLLGVVPAQGRFFMAEDAREGANDVVVISDRLWRDRYGADTAVLDRPLVIDAKPHRIVGIAPPEMTFPDEAALFWVPSNIPAATPETTRVFSAVARLRPGMTTEQAEAEGTAVARSVPHPAASTEFFFGKGGPVIVHARGLVGDITAPIRPALLVIAVAVTLLLLMTCANVANLFLSRGLARQRELAIRTAIGCSRARLVQQLLTESAALAAAGGVLGIFLAWTLVGVLPRLAPAQFPRLDAIRVDAGLLMIGALASVFAAVTAGLAPALHGSRFVLSSVMRGGSDTTSDADRGPRGRRLRRYVLAVEAAFAVILLVGAGLLARSFVRLLAVDPGYRADHVLKARVRLPESAPESRMAAFIDTVLVRVRGTRGVLAAGAGNMTPLTRMTAMTTVPVPQVAGGTPAAARVRLYVVTPGYAEALGLRLREGRVFVDRDTAPGTRKMLVNEAFARAYLAGTPVGRRFTGFYSPDRNVVTEIVGVVGDVLKDGNDSAAQPEVYVVHGSPTDRIDSFVDIVVRTRDEPAALTPTIRNIVREADAALVVDEIAPLSSLVARSVDRPRFSMTIVGAFAALSLMLASVGLGGVISQIVIQRRREFGIRAAIGASRLDIILLVLREGSAASAIGAAAGLLIASWLTRYMSATLFGITPLDTVAFAAAPVFVIAAAILACAYPAWRAASADPAVALRAE